MTPYGKRLRDLRKTKGVTMKQMAEAIGVSPAYLSALEHGKRGRPSWYLIQRINAFLGVIWDDAEELIKLAEISHPRVVIDTSGLSPQATELANLLARRISSFSPGEIAELLYLVKTRETGR